MHRPSIRYNVKHCQVFEDNERIERFMTMIDEFVGTEIDTDHEEYNLTI